MLVLPADVGVPVTVPLPLSVKPAGKPVMLMVFGMTIPTSHSG